MEQRALSFGNFELRRTERALTEDGRLVPLGSRALDILVMLVERPGQVIGKDELIAQVWPTVVVEEAICRRTGPANPPSRCGASASRNTFPEVPLDE